jgi:hypothetical protein
MTSPRKNWHKKWSFDDGGSLCHENGLIFTVDKEKNRVLHANTLAVQNFRAHEEGRGVLSKDIGGRFVRLIKEANEFLSHEQARLTKKVSQ